MYRIPISLLTVSLSSACFYRDKCLEWHHGGKQYIWKGAILAYFKVLSQNFPGGTEENHKTSFRLIGVLVEIPTWYFSIQGRSVTDWSSVLCSTSFTLHEFVLGNWVKDDGMGRKSNAYERDKVCMQNFSPKNLKGNDRVEDLRVFILA
jgi:hypothetical protein